MEKVLNPLKEYTVQSLAWALVAMGGLYQISFVLPGSVKGAHISVLYQSLDVLHPDFPQWWAWPGVVALILLFAGIYLRNRVMLKTASTLQVILWTLAMAIYIKSGVYTLALAVALIQVIFWYWNYALREHENDRYKNK